MVVGAQDHEYALHPHVRQQPANRMGDQRGASDFQVLLGKHTAIASTESGGGNEPIISCHFEQFAFFAAPAPDEPIRGAGDWVPLLQARVAPTIYAGCAIGFATSRDGYNTGP